MRHYINTTSTGRTNTNFNEATQASPLWSPTIQQLVDEHKVVLDVLLADLAKVGRHDVTHLVEELEYHGGVDILLGDGRQPDVGALDMEEAGAGNVGHRGSNLLPGVNYVHAECVHCITPEMGGRARKRKKKKRDTFILGVERIVLDFHTTVRLC